MPDSVAAALARLAVAGGLVACLVVASSASASPKVTRTHTESCAQSTAQWPPGKPGRQPSALTLGPVQFSLLRPLTVQRPLPKLHDVLYHVVSFFDISRTARRGVTISVTGDPANVAILFDGYSHLRQILSGRRPLAAAPKAVRYPLCHDPQSGRPEITQYGTTVVLRKPGCFRLQVQPTGQRRRYAATIRVLVKHC